ncbi:hypothetical protein [Leucobacter musarum]|uniref:hypothetical protein n=1 Tax=Leucobacter musarum TaxID=1930747 RepID=UPI0006A7DAE1|nr:hypothetical protein [Leucobacter musarum]
MWSLKYDGTAYSFDHVAVTSVEIEGRSYRVDDAANPRADGVAFGQDFADPGDIKLKLLLTFQTTRNLTMQRAKLKEAADSFLRAWDAKALRATAGALGELTIPSLGLFEGRPRRAEWDWSTFGLGYLTGAATFVRSDLLTYVLNESGGAPWQSATLGLVPAQVGGIKSPLKAPLRTSVESSRAAPLVVGGSAEAWGIYDLKGPIQSNAQIEVPNRWRLYLNRSLAYNQTARIDTRPGRRGTYLNGKPVQLLDPRSSLLDDCALLPGQNVLALRGASIEGTASVSVRWRDTKESI